MIALWLFVVVAMVVVVNEITRRDNMRPRKKFDINL